VRSEAVMVFLPPKFLDQTNIAFAHPNLAATATSCLLMRRTNSNSQNQSPEFFFGKTLYGSNPYRAPIAINSEGLDTNWNRRILFQLSTSKSDACIVSAWQQLASRSSPKRFEYQVVSVLSEKMSRFSLSFSPPPSFGSAAACPFAFGR